VFPKKFRLFVNPIETAGVDPSSLAGNVFAVKPELFRSAIVPICGGAAEQLVGKLGLLPDFLLDTIVGILVAVGRITVGVAVRFRAAASGFPPT
jgi:hypothetical protein